MEARVRVCKRAFGNVYKFSYQQATICMRARTTNIEEVQTDTIFYPRVKFIIGVIFCLLA